MYRFYLAQLAAGTTPDEAVIKTEFKFGAYAEWCLNPGTFAYGDGVTINFDEITL